MSETEAMNTLAAPLRRSLRAMVGALLVCAAGAVPLAASALPVIPQAAGFGIDTPAGRGGVVHKVTNLNNSGAGSLRACIDASGPRVCVFEVSGIIRATSNLLIRNSNITIAGQTAPSPGVAVVGAGIHVYGASDVLIQHIRVRPGDADDGPNPENRDALIISHGSQDFKNVVIDHCSFSWAIDEMASVMYGWDNVTLSNNIFADPLQDSLHPKGRHGYGVLLSGQGKRATLIGNLLANQAARNPLSAASHLVFANNVVYNALDTVQLTQGDVGAPQNVVLGNVFIEGPNSGGRSPIMIRAAGTSALTSQAKVYLADNVADGATSDPWSIAGQYNGGACSGGSCDGDIRKFRADVPSAWPANLTRLPTSGNVVLNSVLKHAGARPADRDSVDTRVVNGVKNGTGRSINCVAANGTTRCEQNAGGWPTLANNRRALTLPANPNQTAASGYTNLEVWLHRMSAEVEGRSVTPPQAPKLASGN